MGCRKSTAAHFSFSIKIPEFWSTPGQPFFRKKRQHISVSTLTANRSSALAMEHPMSRRAVSIAMRRGIQPSFGQSAFFSRIASCFWGLHQI
jgi:hypothetical protein